MIWMLWQFLSNWASEMSALTWLAVAFIAAILEVTIPHFGSAFVSAGAIAAAAVAYLGFGPAAQLITFIVVLTVSLVTLRSGLVARLGGRGVPSRTDQVIGRAGIVTHDIDPATGTGRVNVGGEDWAARSAGPLAAGSKIRVVGADGIVLEVTGT
ncbi:MAG: NfeD family protein [Acidobacteria bacterium]|nr:NfeD family protein [Acidobacteriota bacterium]